MTINININAEARSIIHQVTTSMMKSVDFNPDNHDDLYDCMVEECAFILSERFLDGVYTPLQYNRLRNTIAKMLWNIFEHFFHNDRNT